MFLYTTKHDLTIFVICQSCDKVSITCHCVYIIQPLAQMFSYRVPYCTDVSDFNTQLQLCAAAHNIWQICGGIFSFKIERNRSRKPCIKTSRRQKGACSVLVFSRKSLSEHFENVRLTDRSSFVFTSNKTIGCVYIFRRNTNKNVYVPIKGSLVQFPVWLYSWLIKNLLRAVTPAN